MKSLVAALLIAMVSFAYSQVVNINPNPNDEPIYVGGYTYDADEQEFIEGLPILVIADEVKEYDLPDSWDNTIYPGNPFYNFRSIFNQAGGSCSQASAIGYMFTYEINRAHTSAADAWIRQYPTHFTYNFLNYGSNDSPSGYGDGIRIATEF